MTDPKTRLKGLTDLGRSVDERIAEQRSALDLRHDAGAALAVPLSGGGSPLGGGGGTGDPVLPESFVTSLMADGESATLSGALVLTGGGETSITQSPGAPHFTIASPALSANNGVQRVGDELSCDTTVVRTSGNQTVGDMKTFSSFPVTPSSAPSGDYEVANKKYVDDNSACLWQRSGTDLIVPKTADDDLRLDAGSRLLWDNGSGAADVELLRGSTNRLDLTDGAVLRLHEQLEQAEISTPATAAAGFCAVYNMAGGRRYLKDDEGNEHDLCVQHKQTFWLVAGQNNDAGLALPWGKEAYPATAGLAGLSIADNVSFDFAGAKLGSAFARLQWDALYYRDAVTLGLWVGAGAPFRKFGDGAERDGNCRVVVKARLKVNDTSLFGALKLFLSDSGSSSASADLLAGLSNDTWAEVTLAGGGTDVGGWGSCLRAGVIARNKAAYSGDGSVTLRLDLEWIIVEQWAN